MSSWFPRKLSALCIGNEVQFQGTNHPSLIPNFLARKVLKDEKQPFSIRSFQISTTLACMYTSIFVLLGHVALEFYYIWVGNLTGNEMLELWQSPRICFTVLLLPFEVKLYSILLLSTFGYLKSVQFFCWIYTI